MFCKKSGKYIMEGQKFCPYCGTPAPVPEESQDDMGMTKVIPDLDQSEMEPLEDIQDGLNISGEIEYEEDGLDRFDFPENIEEKEVFQFEDDDDFYDDEEFYDDEKDSSDELEKIRVTNQNKKLNIIAIAVSVSIVILIVIVAVILTSAFGGDDKPEEVTTTVEETSTIEETADNDEPAYTEDVTEKRSEAATEEESSTKKKKEKKTEKITTEKPTKEKVTTQKPTKALSLHCRRFLCGQQRVNAICRVSLPSLL